VDSNATTGRRKRNAEATSALKLNASIISIPSRVSTHWSLI